MERFRSAIAILSAAVLAGCGESGGGKGPAPKESAAKATPSPAAQATKPEGAAPPRAEDPRSDYKKPYLDETKMKNFIESMKEDKNPFSFLFDEKRKEIRMPTEWKAPLEEYDAFAKKYGFADHEDYTAVWGRILVGQLALAAQEMMKGFAGMQEKMVQNAEAELKKPDLSPEMREIFEEQVKSGKQALAEMKEGSEQDALAPEDLALVKKYLSEIQAQQKKYGKAREASRPPQAEPPPEEGTQPPAEEEETESPPSDDETESPAEEEAPEEE